VAASVGSIVVHLNARTAKFEKQFRKQEKVLRRFENTARRVGKNATQLGKTLTRNLTLPLIAIGTAGLVAFARFDDAMTKSLAIMGDVSPRIRSEMEKTAKSLSTTSTFAAKDLAEGYFFLASAGLTAAQSIKALPVATAFAQAGAFDLALATDLLTDAQSAMGLTVDDATQNMINMQRVSDVLVRANTVANATVQQFSEALTNEAGPAMRAYRIELEEGVAVLAAYADQGIKGNTAGSLFARSLRLLNAMAIKNEKEFKALGIDVFDPLTGNMRELDDIVRDLSTRLGVLSVKQRGVALETLGFRARIQGAILPLLGLGDKIEQYRIQLEKAGGITEEVTKNQLKSLSAQLKLARNRITNVGIALGENLAPKFLALSEKVAALIEGFLRLSPATQSTVIKIGLIVAAAGPAVFILGQLVTSIGALSGAMAAMVGSRVFARLAAQMTATSIATGTLSGTKLALAAGMTKLKAGVMGLVGAFTASSKFTGLAAVGLAGVSIVALAAIAGGIIAIVRAMNKMNNARKGLEGSMDALKEMEELQAKQFGGVQTKTLGAIRRAVQSGDVDQIEKLRTAFPEAVAMAEKLIGKAKQVAVETAKAAEGAAMADEIGGILEKLNADEDRIKSIAAAEEDYNKTVEQLAIDRATGEEKINRLLDKRKKLTDSLVAADKLKMFQIKKEILLVDEAVRKASDSLGAVSASNKDPIFAKAAQQGTAGAFEASVRADRKDSSIDKDHLAIARAQKELTKQEVDLLREILAATKENVPTQVVGVA